MKRVMLGLTLSLAVLAPLSEAIAQPYPAMPPPRFEPGQPPAPRGAWLWEPGHWQWERGRYAWVGGHWIERRPGYARFEPGHWARRGGAWVWAPPHWS